MDELIAQVNDGEPTHHTRANVGWIEVIAGSMFSGKSEELIRRLRRAKIARQKVQVFKPEIDSRFSQNHIVSHSEMRHESANIRSAARKHSIGAVATPAPICPTPDVACRIPVVTLGVVFSSTTRRTSTPIGVPR